MPGESRLRILELRSVFGTGGGPEKTILLSAAHADRARFDVTVSYIRDQRDAVFSIHDRARALQVGYEEITERHSFDPGIWRRLRQLARDKHIDIVHSHDYKTDLLALLLARADGIVPLATAHGWTGSSWRERRIYYPIDQRLLARFPLVLAVSSEIRRALVRAGARPDRIEVVLNSIDPDAFKRAPDAEAAARAALGLGSTELVIGTVGRLEPQKNFALLLEVFAALRATEPRLRLVIVGDGSLRETLRDHAARLGLDGACQLLGHRQDIREVHHAFDLFVQSSVYEGTPNAVLEAMALETPIVATDVGGTAELAVHGQHALIVPSGDAEALRQAIQTCLERRDDARARARAARHRVEGELSFDARLRRVERIYERLAAGRRRPAS